MNSHLQALDPFALELPPLLLFLLFLMKNDAINIFINIHICKYPFKQIYILQDTSSLKSVIYPLQLWSHFFAPPHSQHNFSWSQEIFAISIFLFSSSSTLIEIFFPLTPLQLFLSRPQIISMLPQSMVTSLAWQHSHPHLQSSTPRRTCSQTVDRVKMTVKAGWNNPGTCKKKKDKWNRICHK